MNVIAYKHLYIDTSKPVVFLDIDGVSNGGWQHEVLRGIYPEEVMDTVHRMGDWVCRSKAELLFGLLQRVEAQVIIVSSWCGHNLDSGDERIKELREFFGFSNIIGSLTTSVGVERGLSVVKCIAGTQLKDWVAIDDSYDLYTAHSGFDKERLIACRGR